MKITKHNNLYGIANAVRWYSKEFPNISARPEELDEKLQTFLIEQRRGGENINCHTVHTGVLMDLIKSNLHLYGGYLEFIVTDGWLYSLYK